MKLVTKILLVIALSGSTVVGWASSLVEDDIKGGARFEELGKHIEAAEAYARVLRLEPGNQKARKGLARVGATAVAERVAAAAELERSARFADARGELERARVLSDRMTAVGIVLGPDADVDAAIRGLVSRWIASLYEEAIRAQEEGLWSAAVDHLRQIESLQPGHGDVRRRLVDVWTAWGRSDLEANLYRAAAERFREAARVPGNAGSLASRRAASIIVELGADALDRGACRHAVSDFRAAAQLALDSVDDELLKRAESCALTCLTLAVGSEIEVGMTTEQLDRLRADIRNELSAAGSEFLRIDGPSSAPREPCRPALSSPSASPADPVAARWYRAVVAVTSQAVLRSPATSRNREFRTRRVIDKYTVVEKTVVVRQYEEGFTGTMTGSVTFTDQRSGRVSPAIPIRVTAEETALWVKSPVTSMAGDAAPRGSAGSGVDVNPELQRLARIEDQRREARSRLTGGLLRSFAAETARIALEIVDSEPDVSAPAVIHLPPELFGAGSDRDVAR